MDEEVTYPIFCGLYTGEKDYLTSSEWHRKTQSYLRKRLTNISGEASEQIKKTNKQKTKKKALFGNECF